MLLLQPRGRTASRCLSQHRHWSLATIRIISSSVVGKISYYKKALQVINKAALTAKKAPKSLLKQK